MNDTRFFIPTSHELKINGEWLTFTFDIASFLELERRHGANALTIFNEFLMHQNITRNFVEILAVSCKTRTIEPEYLMSELLMSKSMVNFYAQITTELMDGFLQPLEENQENIEKVKKVMEEKVSAKKKA